MQALKMVILILALESIGLYYVMKQQENTQNKITTSLKASGVSI